MVPISILPTVQATGSREFFSIRNLVRPERNDLNMFHGTQRFVADLIAMFLMVGLGEVGVTIGDTEPRKYWPPVIFGSISQLVAILPI